MNEIEVMDAIVSDSLIDKAVQLIGKLTMKSEHGVFNETYSETLRALIEAKAMGQEVRTESPAKKCGREPLVRESPSSIPRR